MAKEKSEGINNLRGEDLFREGGGAGFLSNNVFMKGAESIRMMCVYCYVFLGFSFKSYRITTRLSHLAHSL